MAVPADVLRLCHRRQGLRVLLGQGLLFLGVRPGPLSPRRPPAAAAAGDIFGAALNLPVAPRHHGLADNIGQ